MKHLGAHLLVDHRPVGHHRADHRAAAPRKDLLLGPLADHHRDHPVAHPKGLRPDHHLGRLHPMHSEVLIQNLNRNLSLNRNRNLNRLKM